MDYFELNTELKQNFATHSAMSSEVAKDHPQRCDCHFGNTPLAVKHDFARKLRQVPVTAFQTRKYDLSTKFPQVVPFCFPPV